MMASSPALCQGQHAHLELHVVLHLVDEVIDGGDELFRIVGITAGRGILDVFAHHLPLQEDFTIGAAQGGGRDPALGLLQLGGMKGLFKLGEPTEDDLILLDFIGHAVGLHAQGSRQVDGLGIGNRIEEGDHGHHGDQAGHEQDQHHGATDGAADRLHSEPFSHADRLPFTHKDPTK